MTTGDGRYDTAAAGSPHEAFTGADGTPGADWVRVAPGAGFTFGPAVPPATSGLVASIMTVLGQVVPELRPAMLAEMRGVSAEDLRDVAGLLREISEEIGGVAGFVFDEARNREASDG